jgi:DnaJ-class molecular chaperone
MPFYEYFCVPCKDAFKTYHGANERAESCPKCNGKEVVKSLSHVTINKPRGKESTAGNRVEKFIEDSRETLKEQLTEARKDYNP